MPVVTEFWLQHNRFMDLLTVHKMNGILLVLVTGEHVLWIYSRLKHHSINIEKWLWPISMETFQNSRKMLSLRILLLSRSYLWLMILPDLDVGKNFTWRFFKEAFHMVKIVSSVFYKNITNPQIYDTFVSNIQNGLAIWILSTKDSNETVSGAEFSLCWAHSVTVF